MELRQLKYFLRVAETLNFSVAAKELFITQSTLSQQIINLERELDQQLFLRNSHEVLLTETGKILIPMARECLHNVDMLFLRVNELKQMLTGELNIGVTYSFSNMIAETMTDFIKEYPKVKLNVCYALMTELIEKLTHHELDFVLAFKPFIQNEHIESHVLFNNRLAAIVNEQHPLAGAKKITLDELKTHSLALPAKGMQARKAFETLISNKADGYNIKAEINDVAMLLKLAHQSNHVTILSESATEGESNLRAIPIDDPQNQMIGCIHVLKDSYTKNSAKEFINMLSQCKAVLRYKLTEF